MSSVLAGRRVHAKRLAVLIVATLVGLGCRGDEPCPIRKDERSAPLPTPEHPAPPEVPPTASLPTGRNLLVVIRSTGIDVFDSEGHFGRYCDIRGAETTIPSAAVDPSSRLTTCASRARGGEKDDVLTAQLIVESQIPVGQVLHAMNAVRWESNRSQLYSSIAFGTMPDQRKEPLAPHLEAAHRRKASSRAEIVVSDSAILVGSPRESVLELPARAHSAKHGVGAAHKGGRPEGLLIVPLYEKLVADGHGPDRNEVDIVIGDRETPWRVVLEVVHTAQQVGLVDYRLVEEGVTICH